MNDEQKKFITDELSPFILRAEGNGFAMMVWAEPWDRLERNATMLDDRVLLEGIWHDHPPCGTVACLGGSAEMLFLRKDGRDPVTHTMSHEQVATRMGLNDDQAEALFYGWHGRVFGWGTKYRWPLDMVEQYKLAKTPLAKAEVAVKLLRHVAETGGECLIAPQITEEVERD